MDLPPSSTNTQITLVVTTFQTAGTLLIALLLRMLTRGVPGRFLHYWSLAWICLAAALVSLNVAFLLGPLVPDTWMPVIHRPAMSAYAIFQYAFGFYVWVGLREYARGTPLTRWDWGLFVPPALFGLIAPSFLPEISELFPFHAFVFGSFCLLALIATRDITPDTRQTLIGLRITQFALIGLVLLFWHYAVVMGWILRQPGHPVWLYLEFSALYDSLIETILGFGMVVLATDSVRRELASKNLELAAANQRLAEMTQQLEVTARTDPLTGLLNRRALDAMIAQREKEPFAGSVAVIDLNNLKQLNDAAGHTAGDAAIQLVARALRAQFRITDPVFRIGGDEFVVILDGGRSTDLANRLEAVDNSLLAQRLPGMTTTTDLVVAWGMADFDTSTEFGDALAQADAAMYACKIKRKAAVAGEQRRS